MIEGEIICSSKHTGFKPERQGVTIVKGENTSQEAETGDGGIFFYKIYSQNNKFSYMAAI